MLTLFELTVLSLVFLTDYYLHEIQIPGYTVDECIFAAFKLEYDGFFFTFNINSVFELHCKWFEMALEQKTSVIFF